MMVGDLMMVVAAVTPGSTGVTVPNDTLERLAMPLLLLVVMVLAFQSARGKGRRR